MHSPNIIMLSHRISSISSPHTFLSFLTRNVLVKCREEVYEYLEKVAGTIPIIEADGGGGNFSKLLAIALY